MPFDNAPVDEVDVILRVARGYIEQGWCQGTEYKDDFKGREYFCVIGAVRRASGMNENGFQYEKVKLYQSALIELAKNVPGNTGKKYYEDCLAEWNDRKSRTRSQVLKLFDTTINS
jgi:hypothetical protein